MTRPDYRVALETTGILEILAGFDPHVAGTMPLGIDLPSSDIDILCHAPEAAEFASAVWNAFSHWPEFRIRQWNDAARPVIASFIASGWPIELFGHVERVRKQVAWRHFLVERRLLALGGSRFRADIVVRRQSGQKTEPAFAAALSLPGDPYQALLDLERRQDPELTELLFKVGFQ